MAAEFLGTGWAFPVQPAKTTAGATRGIRTAKHDELADPEESLIGQSIRIILGTAPGERVMRPEFGCGIHDLVFAVNNSATAGRVSEQVRQALIRWEPRIEVLDVRAVADPATPEVLSIEIEYRVRTTNTVFNLVYPFYLERGIE